MISRPPGELPPDERALLRRAALTFIIGIIVSTILALTLVSAGVNPNVILAIVGPIAVGMGLFLAFGVLKLQRHRAEYRRLRRAQPRSEKLKQAAFSLVFGGLALIAVWTEGNAALAIALGVILGISMVWMVIDIFRAPPG